MVTTFSETETGHARVSICLENTGIEYLIMKVIENAQQVAIMLCGTSKRNILEFNSNRHFASTEQLIYLLLW